MSNQDIQTLQLVRSAKNGDQRAFDKLLTELEPYLKKIAFSSGLYITGSDKEDILQECRLAVYKAVAAFDEDGGMSFRNFAINLVVKRHLATAMSHANRFKYSHHNNAVSLDAPVITGDEDTEQTLADFIQDDGNLMLEDLLLQDEYEEVCRRVLKRLTPLEAAIFMEYGHDSSYKDIAETLDVPHKCVDNALMRIRKKAAEVYEAFIREREEGVVDPES